MKGSYGTWKKEPVHPQAQTGPLSKKPYLQDTSIACTYGSSVRNVPVETHREIQILRNRSIIMASGVRSARSYQAQITGLKRKSNSTRRQQHLGTRLGEKLGGARRCKQSKNEHYILKGRAHIRRRMMPSSHWSLLFAVMLLSNIHFMGAEKLGMNIMGKTNRGVTSTIRHLDNSTQVPSSSPTSMTSSPTKLPTRSPTKSPTLIPSLHPTSFPSFRPTNPPTKWPSRGPTLTPSFGPSSPPSSQPTINPTKSPTEVPSSLPSPSPTLIPSPQPTALPTFQPTDVPTSFPSQGPTLIPSFEPTFQPSSEPTSGPTVSAFPSVPPTIDMSPNPTNAPTSSSIPTNIPSQSPTVERTISPSESKQPTVPPTLSISPSSTPSGIPTSMPTFVPSSIPSLRPSNSPTRTNKPSKRPSDGPTVTQNPSVSLSPTTHPTTLPTSHPTGMPSGTPSYRPTSKPTISMRPSGSPTPQPTSIPTLSLMPSSSPSRGPTVEPTYAETIVSSSSFTQILAMKDPQIEVNFQKIYIAVMESFTPYFSTRTASGDDRIITTCIIDEIKTATRRELSHVSGERENSLRRMQSSNVIIEFVMKWESKHTNVTGYEYLFDNLMKKNNTLVTDEMNKAGLEVNDILFTLIVNPDAPSPPPTEQPSPSPSLGPSQEPTLLPSSTPTDHPSSAPSVSLSQSPSMMPTSKPSSAPSISPSQSPSQSPSMMPSSKPSSVPSTSPTQSPSMVPTQIPSASPSPLPTTDNVKTIITVSGVVAAGAFFVLLGFCVKRKRRDVEDSGSQRRRGGGEDAEDSDPRQRRRLRLLSPRLRGPFAPNFQGSNFSLRFPVRDPSSGQEPAPEASDARSYDSNFMLSTGSSAHDSGSDIEYDETGNLADEFDRYKDQNLEKMRIEVQETLSDVDAMMSQALTNALMDDMDEDEDTVASTAVDPAEVEASVLCEMNDWLKMREGATDDERREFMQEGLNDMVSKVRRGILSPEDGSRIVHGSAAMLGLQLAESLPETTLIVTGMRKKVSKRDMIDAFKEFGELESAAVSSNSRGFGFVRYQSSVSCRKAMERFRVGEIVVQDVGVSVRLLKAENLSQGVDLARQYSNERRR